MGHREGCTIIFGHAALQASEAVMSVLSVRCEFGQGARLLGNCLDLGHMEEEVQVRVQVEVKREEQGIGGTHGKEQGEEQRELTIKRTARMTMEMT